MTQTYWFNLDKYPSEGDAEHLGVENKLFLCSIDPKVKERLGFLILHRKN